MTLREQFALKLAEAKAAYEAGEVEKGDTLKKEAELIQAAIKGMAELDGMQEEVKNAPMRPPLPGSGQGSMPEVVDGKKKDEPAENPTQKAAYVLRFGEEDAAQKAIMEGLAGKNYRQTLWDQECAFAKYVRFGEARLEREERRLLELQIFPFEDIKAMVKNGVTVEAIKATMVEAQGTLGGYAVPVTIQSEIIQRLPGLTIVRGGGATVINLTTGNSTEILEVTGADASHRYTSNLRGQWGSETQSPTDQNLTFGTRTVNADLYTYKVPMSQSLLEDAGNVVNILQDEIVTTLAIDEDDCFLVGDGVGKPMGILPGGTNVLGLVEVKSGNASALTSNGLKALKRGIPPQYRSGAIFVANSETYGEIERMIDGNGQYLYPDLTESDMLLSRPARESEAMPDVGASAYPLLYINMSAYYILERSGLTVQRFQDSNTGPNKVEFHVRRRVGGRLVKTWMAAVQKVAA